ncbi:ATP-dependent zinc metalloprotease FtsH [Sulfuricurvum sp. RIFCSPLOWO2_12_FULL_43_24]|uniref:ATP-dependent zinc metalloprotease FtsH n=1 Tax=Sulfuricurvum sp. RIFCSPLOWO2_12_FULL_43_24 TaxID=1802247 RepID=UPI0008CC9134|nr:ATP-dependent zinc metalloprotease FtsH [Sulfuricurvum sp. RIFCSPLOWO2_12_FULL_43_24]OHD84148.1 MAG: cell division protein FtsH [Sulfuricurvum sp. RIFCSPLOWO2_02_43_6]OHD86154.1 MAG: cell division protein FtsH [Sulfuricurvum sp. RIFCSPLOWO2_02_FULL_43_45]OHD86983.1 MAG: cell division protein FtsH [Sulfuricurvum sp. RIFCSPLOWO2_12_43_5]OHD89177.1 MAG: cell division protein FtsH [Sulfuricurvum sp. RIFCSPLOWO2_12_FULL_43_24]
MAQNESNPNPDKNGNFFNKNPLITFAIFSIAVIILFKAVIGDENELAGKINGQNVTRTQEISYADLKRLIQDKQVEKVSIGQTYIRAIGSDGEGKVAYTTRIVGPDTTLIPLLDEKRINYVGFSESNWFTEMFGWLFPFLIIIAIWMFFAGRMQKSMGGGILGMGNSKKLINSEKPKTKFDDVAGAQEAKEEVLEIVDFLKSPDRYVELGAKIPKGVLLVGSPGTGKTLLAKAVAGEAEVPFFSVSGSSFIEMFVGVGAARVRDLFEQAKKDAPSIIFIDEIDAIGKSRAAGGMMGGNDEREQTLNQLLAEMDGFGTDTPIIILAATNRPEILDPALLRPGRFDRQVLVDKPDFQGRIDILKVHAKGVKQDADVDLEEIARLTAGLAGADLANIINEAALLAGRKSQKTVRQADMREAVERAIAGLSKKSRRIDEKEKRIVAYHESGHALLAETTRGAKKVSKVSIVPRGLAALGYTLNTPEENKYLMQRHELIAEIDVLLGGRAAEEVFIGEISTGAANDLERATDILKAMVQMYGMSDVAGLMVLERQRSTFLGGGMTQAKEYSDKMAEEMDNFIKTTLAERYIAVKNRLEEYHDAIEKIVELLYAKENISGDQVRAIIETFEIEHNVETKLEPRKEIPSSKKIVIDE